MYDDDPVADALRRAAAGDEQAKVEFHRLRSARIEARAALSREGRSNAWRMIELSRARRALDQL